MDNNNNNKLYNKYEAYIYTIVSKYHLPAEDFEDIVQEARLKLLETIKYVDTSLHPRQMSTYIYTALHRCIMTQANLVHSIVPLPEKYSLNRNLLAKVNNSPKELKEKLRSLHIAPKTYDRIQAIALGTVIHLDKDLADDEKPFLLESHYPTGEQIILEQEKEDAIKSIFARLYRVVNQNQKEVMQLYLTGKYSYEEIGKLRGVSRQQIGHVMVACKQRLQTITSANYKEIIFK